MANVSGRVHSRDEIIAEEDLVIDVQFLIHDLMEEKGLNRAQLAEKIGISKARLTQLMGPNSNPTLRNVARILHGMGERLCVDIVSRAKDMKSLSGKLAGEEFKYEEPSSQPELQIGAKADRAFLTIEGNFAATWIQTPPQANDDYYDVVEDSDLVLAAA